MGKMGKGMNNDSVIKLYLLAVLASSTLKALKSVRESGPDITN